MTHTLNLGTALHLIESIATLAFALSGVVEAARRRLDAVGVVVVLADQVGAPQWLGLVASASAATALRLLAMVFDWKIPTWRAQG